MSEDRGFTLIEMMFVLAVIAILVIIAIASFGMSSGHAASVACRQNQRTLESAAGTYASAHDGDMPLVLEDLAPYVKDPDRAFCCPSDASVKLRFGASVMSVECPRHPRD